jgi:hypothetical protein
MRSRARRRGLVPAAAAILLACAACGGTASTTVAEAGASPTASAEPSASAETTPDAVVTAEPVVVSPAATKRPTHKPTPRPTKPSGAVPVTEDSAGQTIRLRVGQALDVELPANHVPPASSGTVLRRASADGGYPTGAPVRARFEAVRAGAADLTSGTDYACLHAEPRCMLPQQLWTVHVVVTA